MMKRPEHIGADWLALEFEVKREHAGWRADIFVSNQIPRLSRTRVKRILSRSAFDDSGKPLKPNRTLVEGDRITIYRPPPDEPDVPRFFSTLYEDEWIMAVDKPAGLPVHPTARYHRNTLTALLRERYGEERPILAHRIDSETSGVLILAKSKLAEKKMKRQFAERRVQKRYLAIVRGWPTPPEGRIEVPLGPDPEGPIKVKMAARTDGLPALTEYRIVARLKEAALVECRPRTGRQHQIRAHLAHLGHPILGDKMYGPDPDLFLDYIDNGPTEEILERAGARRHYLHAAAISFDHPVTNEPFSIVCPLPQDMADMVERGEGEATASGCDSRV
jgi:23S rRNA pseudouridine1911/1915/1917 synthase